MKCVPVDQLNKNIWIILLGGAILICGFILFLILLNVVYRRVTRPISYLVGLINEIKADPEIQIDLGKYPCYEAIELNTELVTLFNREE